jgi:hypothetical protein
VAQLAHEHVDRPVTARHRVAPHGLVDLLAREHPAIGGGEQAQQLVLLARQRGRPSVRARVEPVRADLQLAGDDRLLHDRQLAGAPAPQHRLDAREQFLGVARLGDPVVGPGPQPGDSLADPHRIAHHEHRGELLGCDGLRNRRALPATGLQPAVENGGQAGVGIDQRDPDSRALP